jgi:hypothetical protein
MRRRRRAIEALLQIVEKACTLYEEALWSAPVRTRSRTCAMSAG